MANIKHILKDGTVLKDITGHIVKKEEVPTAYALIELMRKERRLNGHLRTNQESK
jgi:hypothetical protein